jgi:23S rRNA pseudouridine2604 synthase
MIHYYHRRRVQLLCGSRSSAILLLLLLLVLSLLSISISSIVIQVQSFTPVPILTRHRHRHCSSSITIITESSSSRSSSSLNNNNDNGNNSNDPAAPNRPQPIGIRLNKVFKNTHSRREADKVIAEGGGRITINDIPVTSKGGHFVIPYVDIIKLDDTLVQGWEELNYIERKPPTPIDAPSVELDTLDTSVESDYTNENDDDTTGTESNQQTQQHTFEYIKYWKPKGIICTTDLTIPYNIINELHTVDGYNPISKKRIYPVGRLDKDTSGLILLTNDGRLPNSSLRQQYKKSKVYELKLNYCLTGKQELNTAIDRLSSGVTITTETVRNGVRKSLTALTKPCYVEPIYTDDSNSGEHEVWWLRVVLEEGRNRQVRKMINTIGYSVIELERVSFADITLDGLQGPGCWDYLTSSELVIIQEMIQMNASTPPSNEFTSTHESTNKSESLTTINNSDANKVVVDDDDDDAGSVADDESESSLNKLTIPQLKDKLRLSGRKVSGKKQDLIDRLLEASTTRTEEESITEESTVASVASVTSVASESAATATATATATSSDFDSESDFFESISDESLSTTQESATATTSTHESTSTSTSPRRRTPQEYSNNDDDYSISENDNDSDDNNNAIVGW